MLTERVNICPNSVGQVCPLRQGCPLKPSATPESKGPAAFAALTFLSSPTKGKPFGIPPEMRKNPGTQPRIFPFLARKHRPHKYKIHMGQFCVLHMESRAEVSSILERHIVRQEVQYVDGVRVETVWVPDNADASRVHLNRELVSRTVTDPSTGKAKTLTIQQAVNRRIEEAGIKKVRSNQNTCIEVIFSGSPETMCAMSQEQVNNWANETLAWARGRWGYENVVSATLHCDEKTPHMHVIVVPIVQGQSRRSASKEKLDAAKGMDTKKYKTDTTRNRLCANEVYTKPLLYGYHTSYAETVGEKYGLSRGVRAELGSHKKHTSSIEYNRMLAQEAAEKERLIAELTSDYAAKVQVSADIDQDIVEKKQRQTKMESEMKAVKDELVKVLKESSSTLRVSGNNLVVQFDHMAKIVEPTKAEKTVRDELKAECGKDRSEMDIKGLHVHNYNLNRLIDRFSPVIKKMSEKIVDIAESAKRARSAEMLKTGALKLLVPKSQIEEIESVQEMRQKVEEANAAVKAANQARDNALHEMRSALYDKEKAEKKQKEAEDLRKTHLDEAKMEGRRERHKEWVEWKVKSYDPVVAENKELKKELAETKEELAQSQSDHEGQAILTAMELIQKFGHKTLEQAGLDMTTYPSWNKAKRELGIRVLPEPKQSQGPKLKP